MAARVVLLPEPVGPVKRTRPRSNKARFFKTGGMPRSSKSFTTSGIVLNTPANPLIWLKRLTRNRPLPARLAEKSISFLSSKRPNWVSSNTWGSMDSISSCFSMSMFSGCIVPLIRTMGIDPTLK